MVKLAKQVKDLDPNELLHNEDKIDSIHNTFNQFSR